MLNPFATIEKRLSFYATALSADDTPDALNAMSHAGKAVFNVLKDGVLSLDSAPTWMSDPPIEDREMAIGPDEFRSVRVENWDVYWWYTVVWIAHNCSGSGIVLPDKRIAKEQKRGPNCTMSDFLNSEERLTRLDESKYPGLIKEMVRSSVEACRFLEEQYNPVPAQSTDDEAHDTPVLGTVDEGQMRVYTSKGWVSTKSGNVLIVVKNLTREKRVWLKNWECFGGSAHTENRVDKLPIPDEIRRHIESGHNGYRWIDLPSSNE